MKFKNKTTGVILEVTNEFVLEQMKNDEIADNNWEIHELV